MKQLLRVALLLALGGFGVFAQTAKDDVKKAGHETKKAAEATGDAAKKAGSETKKATKKAGRTSASTAKKATHATAGTVEDGASKVEKKTQ